MKAYVICFILTILFTYLAQMNFKKENKKFAIFFSIFAIFIPTFICAIRQVGVGRDIDIYVIPALNNALKYNFNIYINSYLASVTEKGYMIWIYIMSKFTSSYNVLLFFIQLVPCVVVYIFSYYYRKEIPMWLTMTTYLLTWYFRSYTMMRQSIAVGIILLSIIMYEKNKKVTTVFLFLLAIVFHKSTSIAIGIYPIIWLCETNSLKKKDKVIIFTIILSLLFIVLYHYEKILYFGVNNLKIFPEYFLNYLTQFSNEELDISISETAFRLIFFGLGLLFCFLGKSKDKEYNNFLKFFLLYIISLIPFIISFKVINAERMNYYYYYPALLYMIPSLTRMFKKDKINQVISSFLIVSLLFVFWFFKYPIKKNCETYPYSTSILKILN